MSDEATITIRFGRLSSVTKPLSEFPNASAIRNSASLKAILGFPDNIEIRVAGASFGDAENFQANAVVDISTASNSKG